MVPRDSESLVNSVTSRDLPVKPPGENVEMHFGTEHSQPQETVYWVTPGQDSFLVDNRHY